MFDWLARKKRHAEASDNLQTVVTRLQQMDHLHRSLSVLCAMQFIASVKGKEPIMGMVLESAATGSRRLALDDAIPLLRSLKSLANDADSGHKSFVKQAGQRLPGGGLAHEQLSQYLAADALGYRLLMFKITHDSDQLFEHNARTVGSLLKEARPSLADAATYLARSHQLSGDQKMAIDTTSLQTNADLFVLSILFG